MEIAVLIIAQDKVRQRPHALLHRILVNANIPPVFMHQHSLQTVWQDKFGPGVIVISQEQILINVHCLPASMYIL